ncbi:MULTISPECIES: hypothetical protein [Rhodonellum]|uniref:Uncharacterized protein n=1 Tax=Rhodonellum ikkaensis TaxID=336829 RepID=A0A1H3TYH8_9BACT|nr:MULTISPECIES: hypothetical protein [Rhodonellum]SDZ55107.1 hypothetical protein SAMN05444412_12316 [Rhodonellum ikkaensis]
MDEKPSDVQAFVSVLRLILGVKPSVCAAAEVGLLYGCKDSYKGYSFSFS